MGNLTWVDWYNTHPLKSAMGYVTPKEAKEHLYANLLADEKVA